jgi:hypothetical protein
VPQGQFNAVPQGEFTAKPTPGARLKLDTENVPTLSIDNSEEVKVPLDMDSLTEKFITPLIAWAQEISTSHKNLVDAVQTMVTRKKSK